MPEKQAPPKTLQAQIGGMDCGSCARTIEKSLQQMPGIGEAELQTPRNFKALPGQGIWANLGNKIYFVGNRRLFTELTMPLSLEAESLLGTFGFVGLAVAVLADTGTSLLVTANGMRLFRARNKRNCPD